MSRVTGGASAMRSGVDHGDAFRAALARECEQTREIIRLNAELLKADLHALEARLMLRIGTMWGIFLVAAGRLIKGTVTHGMSSLR